MLIELMSDYHLKISDKLLLLCQIQYMQNLLDLVSDRVRPARGGCCSSDPGFRVKISGVVRPVRVSGSGCPRGVRPADPPRNPPRSTLGIFIYMILYNISTNSIYKLNYE